MFCPFGYTGCQIGMLKIATLVIGAVGVGTSVYAHYWSAYTGLYRDLVNTGVTDLKIPNLSKEQFYIRYTSLCLCLSFLHLIGNFCHRISEAYPRCYNRIDFLLQIISIIVFFIAGVSMVRSAMDIDRSGCANEYIVNSLAAINDHCQKYNAKIAAGVLALFNGVLYICAATLIFFYILAVHMIEARLSKISVIGRRS